MFEQFEAKFQQINQAAENATEVDLALIKQKLFVDEFFSLKLGTGQVIPPDAKTYDIKQNFANE